ncbi:Planctomycete cytochrome C [Neorhodopirellula pilleata]|uniref:Planctomycete cytochrome C n=1 Tax=Neorhodopirellula pilleata TaxID=2714738 RepID=A0A5C6AZE1_9BACT|nr:Planctomycete cytochrome C [Neorhodopirellula pilleata]
MRLFIRIPIGIVAILAAVMACSAASSQEGTIDFQRDLSPLLQRRCLSCHSGNEPKGDFSLQVADAAMSGGYIEPGDASASHLVDLITPVDGKAEMPKDADPLTSDEIMLIRKWIDEGASWPQGLTLHEPRVDDFNWWSYQPLIRPPVPQIDHRWATSSIDKFILDKLNQKELTPSEPADRRTLIRRVTYDLIGLPPTQEQVDQFVNDTDPQAYVKLVDRLLGSKHYGERWARHWLDVVKYADTHGYDKDKLRDNAWPYRDYVIRSFNEDKPYSRFVQEQVAGDVLFPGQPDGILGLGFIAAGPWDHIGHVEVPETKIDGKVARNLDRDDMVSNTLNTFCSVTVQCARCHNHKFDPITQDHYYGLQSLFAAVDRADRVYDLDPNVQLQRDELEARLAELRKQESESAKETAALGGPRLTELKKQIAEFQAKTKVVKKPQFGYHTATSNNQDDEKWVEVDLEKKIEVSRIVLRPCHDDFGNIGAGFGFPVRFRVEVSAGGDWKTVFDQTTADFPNPGLSPVEVATTDQMIRRIRVTATKLADRKGVFIMALAELQGLKSDGTDVALGAKVTSVDSIEAPVRWARQNLTDGEWAQSGDPDLQQQLDAATKEYDKIMASINTPERIRHDDEIRKEINQTQDRLSKLPTGKMVYAAATNFRPQGSFMPTAGKPRMIRVLHRGNVEQPGEPAVPCVLPFDESDDFLLATELDESQRRAALAQWLTRKNHPLLWRSIVNRIWQYHFGRGIVETPNDFGRMGAKPTHPELLDWLAAEFRDSGESMKSLHRLIVTSNTYQQSARHDTANAAIDADNQYLWRADRRPRKSETRFSRSAVRWIRRWAVPVFICSNWRRRHTPRTTSIISSILTTQLRTDAAFTDSSYGRSPIPG